LAMNTKDVYLPYGPPSSVPRKITATNLFALPLISYCIRTSDCMEHPTLARTRQKITLNHDQVKTRVSTVSNLTQDFSHFIREAKVCTSRDVFKSTKIKTAHYDKTSNDPHVQLKYITKKTKIRSPVGLSTTIVQ